MKIEQIEKLNAERTQGKYRIAHSNKFGLLTENTQYGCFEQLGSCDVIGVGLTKQRANAEFIAAAPTITDQYIKARRFEVTDDFVESVLSRDPDIARFYCCKEDSFDVPNMVYSVAKAVLAAMWAEVEGE